MFNIELTAPTFAAPLATHIHHRP